MMLSACFYCWSGCFCHPPTWWGWDAHMEGAAVGAAAVAFVAGVAFVVLLSVGDGRA